jgi:hypothetical protein
MGGAELLCGLAAIAVGIADLARQETTEGQLRFSAAMALSGLITAMVLGAADWRMVTETPLIIVAFMGVGELALTWVDWRRLKGLPPPAWLA